MIVGAPALRLLSVAACMLLLGCSPASTSRVTAPRLALSLAYADDAAALVRLLSQRYSAQQVGLDFDLSSDSHAALMTHLRTGQLSYFITPHLEPQVGLWAAPLAQDGLVLVVHPQNPLNDLSLDDARRLYQGYIRRWQELGGRPVDVRLLSREEGSAARLTFEARLLGTRRLSANAQLVSSLDNLRRVIQDDEGAIGYLLYSQLSAGLKPLALDGVLPSQASISSGAYPLTLTVYIVGRGEPEGELRQFLGWVQSAAGQAVLSDCCAPLPR
ncbi:MAG: substrate-binding domain-containing protein [Anaerolineae bacterium]|nr:substrate-binding domain-containing protein [Anaerolineae bacterium]MDW8172796.1 substrate-binding domain-containing protein [Anaerolineae bacterium]